MSANAFIRRPNACDILIEFNDPYTLNHQSAWEFCQTWLLYASGDTCREAHIPYEQRGASGFWHDQVVGTTEVGRAICYCMHDGMPLDHYSDTYPVNPRGTVALTQEEALMLGANGEPDGFVPYASQDIWRPDRTAPSVDEVYETQSVGHEDSEEPCTFGMERGICRCCGELTIERDEAAY